MTHPFFAKSLQKTLVIPNKIIVQSRPDDSPSYQGEATDSESYALLPRTEYYQTYLTSNEQATKIAEAKLSKAQLWSDAGALSVPLNTAQETYDYIKATDSREGDTRTGNIGTLTRRYVATKNKWTMGLSFGNWQTVRKALADLGITADDIENYFSRLAVGDLYVEHILADNIDLVWIDPDGTIDLSQIGDNIDNLPDGEVYARVKTLHLDAGQIKLDENVLYSSGYDPTEKEAGIPKQDTPPSNPSVDDLWIDTSGTMNILKRWDGAQWVVSTPEDLDDLPDGTTYQRVKSAALTPAGLVVLDNVVIGTYGLVKSTDISAGHIKLDTVVEGTYGLVKSTDIQSGHIKLSTAYGDLDDIDNGSTYSKLKTTDIDAGHIKLSSYTKVSGEWYDYSGVEIDADHGINIYGDGALTTRASKAGTIQCKVDTNGAISAGGGDVVLDTNGIRLIGEHLRFYYSSLLNERGYIYGGSTAFAIKSPSHDLQLMAGINDNIWLGGNASGLHNRIDMRYADKGLTLPRKTSAPSSPPDGLMVYNPSTGNLNIYSPGNGNWWHVNRDTGWA